MVSTRVFVLCVHPMLTNDIALYPNRGNRSKQQVDYNEEGNLWYGTKSYCGVYKFQPPFALLCVLCSLRCNVRSEVGKLEIGEVAENAWFSTRKSTFFYYFVVIVIRSTIDINHHPHILLFFRHLQPSRSPYLIRPSVSHPQPALLCISIFALIGLETRPSTTTNPG